MGRGNTIIQRTGRSRKRAPERIKVQAEIEIGKAEQKGKGNKGIRE